MGSVKEYFSSLGTGISSLIKGMGVTGKEFFTPKVTESYPDSRKGADPSEPRYQQYAAPRFRAKLQFIYLPDGRNRCTACGTCQRNCPNGTITITTKMVDLPDGKKKRKLDKYMYDLGSCTFCELCVTTCPFDAIEFSNDFEQAVFTREKLVQQLNYLPEQPGDPAPKAPAAAPKAAPAAPKAEAPSAPATEPEKKEN
ncbi:4Fe-4S binding protein [Muribaculum intestinale]|jgi:NADH-quinone oxidoreductase subunit I|uniref:4Fe-4S binding protein n=1 Tax=Muribaculum intestinale TaxID=1796646 RepID=UPI000F47F5C6|nr:4Fe-4S binding protein [Muribaculum intestinale]ROT11297.1 4Fe-4S dicluster domain-containing protein [Muribaculaceae bacterium Isolate-100 (HZI)]RXE67308.1 4Fe-4S dicluster domain-containing protein [Muribaculaceae bacterium Isolate-007 (NCI)]